MAEPAPEALAQEGVEGLLAGVAERGMAEVVTEPDRLDEILVEVQCAGDCACNARRSRACA